MRNKGLNYGDKELAKLVGSFTARLFGAMVIGTSSLLRRRCAKLTPFKCRNKQFAEFGRDRISSVLVATWI
jgi:hypothetical protein